MEGQVLNISPVVVWVVALSQLLTFGLTIWGLMASGSRANTKRIDDHAAKLDDHKSRIGSLEQSHQFAPTKGDIQKIVLAMEGVKGDVKVMRAEMSGNIAIMVRLEAIVSRHEDHLLGGSKR